MLVYLHTLLERILREPILLRNAGIGLVYILALVGIDIPQADVDRAVDVLLTVLAFAASWFFSRGTTTPLRDPVLPAGTSVRVEGTNERVTI